MHYSIKVTEDKGSSLTAISAYMAGQGKNSNPFSARNSFSLILILLALDGEMTSKQRRASQTEQPRLRLRKKTIVDLRRPANLSESRELSKLSATADTMIMELM